MKRHPLKIMFLCGLIGTALFAIDCAGQSFSPDQVSVTVSAQPRQASKVPVLLTITVKNIGKKSINYWCGGPGTYLDARFFSAEWVDWGKPRKVDLHNWQYEVGSGANREIKPGEEQKVPVAIDPLSPGDYRVTVNSSPVVEFTIVDDEACRRGFVATVLAGVGQQDPFLTQVAANYQNDEITETLLIHLMNTDLQVATRAGYALTLFRVKLSAKAVPFCGEALKQHLSSTAEDPHNVYARRELLGSIAEILSQCPTDESLKLIVDLAHNPAIDIYAMDAGNQDNQLRAGLMNDLGKFSQPLAQKELEGFLSDRDHRVQCWAANNLAHKKDPLALETLLQIAQDAKNPEQTDAFNSLLEYPNDPRVKSALEKAAHSHNSNIKSEAEFALKQLHNRS